jgi:RNA polymerase sigma-70 factor (ECF subfamily)
MEGMVPVKPLARPQNAAVAAGQTLDFDEIYRAYFGFVWRCLQGLGVATLHLDDAAQDVFMTVHRRLPEFRGDSSLRTWVYGIVRNVAANHRRSQRRRSPPEQLGGCVCDGALRRGGRQWCRASARVQRGASRERLSFPRAAKLPAPLRRKRNRAVRTHMMRTL